MINFSKVNKFFDKKQVLKNINIQVKAGEIVGFLGPNGAGKTTTMRIIVGFLKQTSGDVKIFGTNPIINRLNNLKKIGYLPENNPLYPEMKVEEYLHFVNDIKKGDIDDLFNIVKSVGVEDVLKTKIEELSRGFKQRVGLAAALIGNPELLILDEPTSGLDPLEQEKIKKLILSLGKKRTVILSSHILTEIEVVASKLIIINKGEIVYCGSKPKKKGDTEKLFRKLVK